MTEHEQNVSTIFSRATEIFSLNGFTFKTMRRVVDEKGKGILNLKKTYTVAYTDLAKKSITIDIYTPRHRKPKSLKSIINALAHEIAHHQKPPFRQRWRGRIITRQHFPEFYGQVNKNSAKLLKDKTLSKLIEG